VNAVALFACLQQGTDEGVIRITGLVLQVLGIGTVAWGIQETRKLFGYPPFASEVKEWLSKFPLFRRGVVVGSVGTSNTDSTAKGIGYASYSAGKNPTPEARLEALERNINVIHDRITAAQKEMDQGLQKATDALKQEQRARQEDETAIRDKLEATGTGGIHISAIGASWLLVGVILSTAAPEIERLIR